MLQKNKQTMIDHRLASAAMATIEGDHNIRREADVHESGLLGRGRDPEIASIVAFTSAYYKLFLAGLSIITGRRQILLGGRN